MKKPAKGTIILVSIFAAIILVFGIKSVGENKGSVRKKIVVVLPSSTNPFWIDVRRGAEEAQAEVTDYKIEIKATVGDQDSKAQSYMLQDIATRTDVAAVVIGPASASEPVQALALLTRKSIPWVVVDTTLDQRALNEYKINNVAFIGSNNRDGAIKAARAINAELNNKNAQKPFYVLVLEGNHVHQSAIDRADGFYSEAKRLGMEVDGVRADWSRTKAQDWVTEKFSVNRKPQAIFASNDDMAIGAITGLKSLGLDRASWPVIVGFDYTEPAIRAIESGDMLGSAKQDPLKMGREGVLIARQSANHDLSQPTTPQYLPIDIYPLVK